MSVTKCAHCNASGKCQCFECVKAVRGETYADKFQGNVLVANVLMPAAKAAENPLLVLLLLPRALAGAAQANETFNCNVCKGRGYNQYFGRKRFGAVR